MRQFIRVAAFGVAILASVGGAVATDVIAERKEAMKATGPALKAVRTAVEGNKATDAVAPAETIAATMKKAAALFPQGSGSGDTDALPAIWTDWATFETAAANSAAAAEKLAMVAKSGDAAATGEAMKALGGTCGACHKPFRKPQT